MVAFPAAGFRSKRFPGKLRARTLPPGLTLGLAVQHARHYPGLGWVTRQASCGAWPLSQEASAAHRSSCFWCFSSRAWAFICCTSMVSGFLRRMYSSWLPMQSCRIRLLILSRGA